MAEEESNKEGETSHVTLPQALVMWGQNSDGHSHRQFTTTVHSFRLQCILQMGQARWPGMGLAQKNMTLARHVHGAHSASAGTSTV